MKRTGGEGARPAGRPRQSRQAHHAQPAAAGRQLQHPGHSRLLKVGHVAPVMGVVLQVHMVLKITEHHGALAQARAADGVNVVASMRHRQRKPDCRLSAVLADNLRQGLKLTCGLEGQIFQYAGFVELIQRQ